MIKKIPIILASFGILSASVGATAASWAVTDNADPFGIKISVSTPTVQHTVTFYKTFNNGSWGNSETITVNHGETLIAPIVSLTGYTTLGWNETVPSLSCYTPYDEFKVENINNLPITKDMTLYPNIESNNDKVYINQLGYVGDVDTDITISTSSIGQTLIGKEYIGVTNGVCNPKASWNNSRNLFTSSGVYKFSNENGAAVVRRKFGFKPNSNWASSWDGDPAFFIHTWDSSSSRDVLLGNTLIDGIVYNYINATDINFKLYRNKHSQTTIDFNQDHSNDLSFDSSWWWGGSGNNHYSSSTIVLNMWSEAGWNNWGSDKANWIS